MKNKFVLLSAALAIIITLTSCSSGLPPNAVYDADDLLGKTVGVLSGSGTEIFMKSETENINIRTCIDASSLSAELLSGEVDAVIADDDTAELVLKKSSKLKKLDTPLAEQFYCVAVSQDNTSLLNNINSAIATLEKEGVMEKLYKAWFEGGDSYEPENTAKEYEQTLTVAISAQYAPYSFYNEDGELDGYEVMLAKEICAQLEVNAEFRVVDPDKVLYMAESGKVNFSVGRIARGDGAVLYSDSYMTSIQNILVRKD